MCTFQMEKMSVQIDALHLALGNEIIMKKIVSSLDDQDLDLWYECCKELELHDVTTMDRICWKKRAQKLAEAMRITNPIEHEWPQKTYREIHTILKNDVETQVTCMLRIRKIFNNSEDVAKAASLAYHGLLPKPIWNRRLRLYNVNLSTVPMTHLTSLVSSFSFSVQISNVDGCDLTPILDSVRSRKLHISSQNLSKQETRALVRAMETHVKKLILGGLGPRGRERELTLDNEALSEFSGDGKLLSNAWRDGLARRLGYWHKGEI